MRLLDWLAPDGSPVGRNRHQDEYAEWRTVWRGDRLQAIELTTELREDWEALAASSPMEAINLVGEFAGEPEPKSIFGGIDPTTVTQSQRVEAFGAHMLETSEDGLAGPLSEFNSGRRAITCTINRSNDLRSLRELALSASNPYLVHDNVTGRTRHASGSEAITGLSIGAVDGRNSDPLVVERLVRLTTDGRSVTLDEAGGVYIRNVQLHELAQPDGADVPDHWLTLSRGVASDDGRTRARRLSLRVPLEADFALNDVMLRRTGQHLQFGGQLAELVQVAVDVRVGPAGAVADVEVVLPERVVVNCDAETESWKQFRARAEHGGLAG
jgi:hypothetical protein